MLLRGRRRKFVCLGDLYRHKFFISCIFLFSAFRHVQGVCTHGTLLVVALVLLFDDGYTVPLFLLPNFLIYTRTYN